MSKISLALVLIATTIALIKAVPPPAGGPPAIGGPPSFQLIQNYILQAAAAKLSTANLPEDLQQQVEQVLESAGTGFSACDGLSTAAAIPYWQQKQCSIFQLRNTLGQLALIQREAALRNITAEVAQAVPAEQAVAL